MGWIPSYKKPSGGGSYTPPTWSDGTDEEIIEALEKHYAGEIDLTEYWSVGDERVIHLNACNASSSAYTIASEQDSIWVLMNVGGKQLTTPINNKSECAFVVGLKGVLSYRNDYFSCAMGSRVWSDTNNILRYWLNNKWASFDTGLPIMLPASILGIFKEFVAISGSGEYTDDFSSVNNYFAVPSEKEVLGTNVRGSSIAEDSLSQFEYYKTSANRVKHYGSSNNYFVSQWWTRTGDYYAYSNVLTIVYDTTYGEVNSVQANSSNKLPVSPFGVI